MRTERDEALYYECAVDMCSSLMAHCTAVESSAVRSRGASVETDSLETDMTRLRRAYLAELRALDPSASPAVTAKIREWGTALAPKVPAPRRRKPTRANLEDYRLDRDEHSAIFEHAIHPEVLGELRSSQDPIAVIVAGAPATGKTTVVRDVVASWSGAAPAIIDPELLQAYHPRSWELVLAEDADAAEVVKADALGWTALAVDAAIDARSSIVLELGTESPDDVEVFATVLSDCGYGVELEVTVLPEPVRRLRLELRRQCRQGNWAVLGDGPV